MYSEILKAKVKKILSQIILRKYIVKRFLTSGNNLRKKVFKNFEQICNFSKILRKFKDNYETDDSVESFSTLWIQFEKIRSRKF